VTALEGVHEHHEADGARAEYGEHGAKFASRYAAITQASR
jgi:hypothetical protein